MSRLPGLRAFVEKLEKYGELKRVRTPVSPVLEITEITDRIVKAEGLALLFEETGTPFPVLINAYGSERRMALALGVEGDSKGSNHLDAISTRMQALFSKLLSPKALLLEKLQICSQRWHRWRASAPPSPRKSPLPGGCPHRRSHQPFSSAYSAMLAGGWRTLYYPSGGAYVPPPHPPAQCRYVPGAGPG